MTTSEEREAFEAWYEAQPQPDRRAVAINAAWEAWLASASRTAAREEPYPDMPPLPSEAPPAPSVSASSYHYDAAREEPKPGDWAGETPAAMRVAPPPFPTSTQATDYAAPPAAPAGVREALLRELLTEARGEVEELANQRRAELGEASKDAERFAFIRDVPIYDHGLAVCRVTSAGVCTVVECYNMDDVVDKALAEYNAAI